MLARSDKYDATGGPEQVAYAREVTMNLIKQQPYEKEKRWFALFSVSGYHDPQAMSSKLDMLIHLALWIVVMVFEIMMFVKADDWHKLVQASSANGTGVFDPSEPPAAANAVPFPYALASLVLLSTSMGTMILLTILVSWFIDINSGHSVDTYLVTLINGTLKLSMLFTLIVVIFATDMATSTDEWRGRTIVLITFKSLLMTQLSNNIQKI